MKSVASILMAVILPGAALAAWDVETVDDQGLVGSYSSLVIDSSGYPHISYYYQTGGALKYAVWSGSSWQIETVDNTGNVGEYSSLALDTSGNPHISYYYQTGGDLKYASWNGSSWAIETVDNTGNVGEYTSLELDSSGNPHISYYNVTGGDLKYAFLDGSSWHVETVDSPGYVGKYTSLALGPFNRPCISYYYETGHDLKYACWDNTGVEGAEGLSGALWLDMPVPSPFTFSVDVAFYLPGPSQARLSVYSISGRLITGLVNGAVSSGEQTVSWNPDPSVPSGCYLITLDACGDKAVRRCVLLR